MIITLCGSAKFEDLFKHYQEQLALQAHLVWALDIYPSQKDGVKEWYDAETKIRLSALYFKKISISDAILVLNKDGYIGISTAHEIAFARKLRKRIFYLELPSNLADAMCATQLFSTDWEAIDSLHQQSAPPPNEKIA